MRVGPEHIAHRRTAVRGPAADVLPAVYSMLRGFCLVAGLILATPWALLAQDTSEETRDASEETPAPPTYVPDARTLTRIQSVLDADSPAQLRIDGLTFYLSVTETRPTFADYLRGTGKWFEISPIEPPSNNRYGSRLPAGAGIDLLSIFRSMNRALDERKARQIRRQIDRELDAIDGIRSR